MKTATHIGRVVSVPEGKGFGFVGIDSVGQNDGSAHGLDTTADIFLHQDDCSERLVVGLKVSFTVTPDTNRGTGHYRAVGAVRFADTELLPSGAPLEGFGPLALFDAGDESERSLSVPATPAQRAMKPVPRELVEKVLANRPAADVARDSSKPSDDAMPELLKAFLAHIFPAFTAFGIDFNIDADTGKLEEQMKELRTAHSDLGMADQLENLEEQYACFLAMRKALAFMRDEELVRRDTFIPIKYLPDFFMAVPVWYFWMSEEESHETIRENESDDPFVHDNTTYFCELFPNQEWADMFQLYNRRLRPLRQYRGDLIPPSALRRIREMSTVFDFVVIMTPYHDVAGSDWDNPSWIRSIDPYVVGFKKGVPYFFILARFSDSGTFPLFAELIADTMNFLSSNKEKLDGFNEINAPYWHMVEKDDNWEPGDDTQFSGTHLGDHLQEVVGRSLAAYEQGKLFDWLRGEWTASPAQG